MVYWERSKMQTANEKDESVRLKKSRQMRLSLHLSTLKQNRTETTTEHASVRRTVTIL